jgi:hypothetical protein
MISWGETGADRRDQTRRIPADGARRDAAGVRLFTRNNWSARFPSILEAASACRHTPA